MSWMNRTKKPDRLDYSLTQNYMQSMQFSANGKRPHRRLFRSQFLLLMKLTTVLLLATCLQVSATAVSQTVTLRLSNAPLEKTLKDIAAQTGYELFYRLEQMKEAKTVSIQVNKAELKSVLDVIFSTQPFTYAIANKTIILSPRPVLPVSPSPDTIPTVDVKGKTMNVPGSLDVKLSVTSMHNTARYTAHILSRGCTDDVKNQRIYFSDETLSFAQVREQLERATESKFTVVERSLKEMIESEKSFRGQEGKLIEAWLEGFRILMAQQVGVVWKDEQVWNSKHFPLVPNTVEPFAKLLFQSK